MSFRRPLRCAPSRLTPSSGDSDLPFQYSLGHARRFRSLPYDLMGTCESLWVCSHLCTEAVTHPPSLKPVRGRSRLYRALQVSTIV